MSLTRDQGEGMKLKALLVPSVRPMKVSKSLSLSDSHLKASLLTDSESRDEVACN